MLLARKREAWVCYPRPNPSAPLRLFCFPYAGGSGSSFRAWERELPNVIETCFVQFPGREMLIREAPCTDLSSLLEGLEEALLPQFNKPFVFYGHGLGALVSFELARRLRFHRYPVPLHLLVSGYRAPQLPNPHELIHRLNNQSFIEEVYKLGETAEETLCNTKLMDQLLPSMRADFMLDETYRYILDAPFEFPITAFGGEYDWKVSRAELHGWRVQTQNIFSLRMLPGSHFFIHSHKHLFLRTLVEELALLVNILLSEEPNIKDVEEA
jgi:medium-chain acyl-[acyl-carrier-protein] hydrolase